MYTLEFFFTVISTCAHTSHTRDRKKTQQLAPLAIPGRPDRRLYAQIIPEQTRWLGHNDASQTVRESNGVYVFTAS